MAVTGIFLKGNVANIVTLTGTKKDHSFVDESFSKLELGKNPTQKDVAQLLQTLNAYVKKNDVKSIILNRRITAGQMAGAAGTFIWEGILLAASPLPLKFIHAATLRATEKKSGELKRKFEESEVLKAKAYDFAFEGLK
ncbi:MAG: DUF3010 family protein [Deltaproteobacteria bacterium]|nr:DUF3010 family protein [Deltaproteobacteria bacterium]